MGKDWLYRGGGTSSSSTGGGGRSTKKGRSVGDHTPSGCMSAVFQLFDFHHFQLALHQEVPTFKPDSFLPEEPTSLKGVEAPRNSLEMETASFPSTKKEEETLNIPMGIIQIKTTTGGNGRSKTGRTEDLSSECSSSPGSKTPNLVARLMGLDLLPLDSCSTSSSSSTSNPPLKSLSGRVRSLFYTDIIGTRSLPETPRISSARRSDVEYHHRLSLQLNKENICATEESKFSSSRRELVTRQEDESRSPAAGSYARQIAKLVKESVSRRVGVDITNTIRNREIRGDDDHVVLLKSKKPNRVVGDESSSSKKSTTSTSPRLIKNKNQLISSTPSPKLSPLSSPVNAQPQPQQGKVLSSRQQNLQNPNQKSRRIIGSERYGPRIGKHSTASDVFRNKQEEPFVRSSATNRANVIEKKCKKTPLSSELLSINVPTLFPVKKDPSYPSSSLPQKQSQESDALSSKRSPQLSSSSSQLRLTYKQDATHTPAVQGSNNRYTVIGSTTTTTTTNIDRTEFQYITGILNRTGVDKKKPVSFTKWYSPSHPLHPSIFNLLELSFLPTSAAAAATTTVTTKDSPVSHRCNRKLIFQLVDEILVEILKPHINSKPWVSSSVLFSDHPIHGSELIDKICTKIRSFPSADCRVLEAIDELIEKDLKRPELRSSTVVEEEGEAIVAELERDLVESLVDEVAMGVVFGNRV